MSVRAPGRCWAPADDFVQFCSHHTERESDKLQGVFSQGQWSWSDRVIGDDARSKIYLVVLK